MTDPRNSGIKEGDDKKSKEGPSDGSLNSQYNRIAEDWRHFNNILWGIPTVAVSVMAGIVVAAYQPSLLGWPRFVLLASGSLFLFALTAEVLKKQAHIHLTGRFSSNLQNALKLKDDYEVTTLVFDYWDQQKVKDRNDNSGIFWLTERFYYEGGELRKHGAGILLAYVVFIAAISVALLAALDFIGIIFRQYHITFGFEFP